MARTQTTAEYTTFIKGLITEASPINFIENASIDEVNMVLNRDGSRQRRLGFDLEDGHTEITTSVISTSVGDLGISTFKWDNAGGDPAKSLAVIQVGNEVNVFDLDSDVLSDGLIHTSTFGASSSSTIYSYAVVDGLLIVVTGEKAYNVFEYDGDVTITETSDVLYIRDMFGVEDIIGGVDLKQLSNIETRPSTIPSEHLYNLRNQTFAIPRVNGNTETVTDPITAFYGNASLYPSNSDSVIPFLHADPNDTNDRTIDRFFPKELKINPPGSSKPPIGYFIIDAMERGTSRLAEEVKLRARYTSLTHTVTSLPQDKTPGGPSVVTEFAGRAWFAGFSAELTDGDNKSPRLSSYVLFSKLVEDSSDINKCYQEGDPTSPVSPDIIDTDGGFIRLDGAYGIKKIINAGNSLIVIAQNGVWRIIGGNDSGFSSTNYLVSKISSNGCRGSNSIVNVENTVIFWGDDGIYHVKPNEFGDWIATNVTQTTIQSLYNNISIEDINTCQGLYDKFERKVRWVYNNRLANNNETQELVFDINIGAFYKNTIHKVVATSLPRPISLFEQQPFKITSGVVNIVSNGNNVVSNTDNVVSTIDDRESITKQLGYVVVTGTSPTIKFTFGNYSDDTFYDFVSVDSTGVDAAAYLVTGYIMADDTQRYKQSPYLTCHFNRTETGFEDDGSGNISAANPSSCLVQAQWEWTDSAASNRWSTAFQAYRYRQHYFPTDVNDIYDYGYKTITTKNKLRGKGRALSLKFSSEAGKDLHLYGWGLILGITGNV